MTPQEANGGQAAASPWQRQQEATAWLAHARQLLRIVATSLPEFWHVPQVSMADPQPQSLMPDMNSRLLLHVYMLISPTSMLKSEDLLGCLQRCLLLVAEPRHKLDHGMHSSSAQDKLTQIKAVPGTAKVVQEGIETGLEIARDILTLFA